MSFKAIRERIEGAVPEALRHIITSHNPRDMDDIVRIGRGVEKDIELRKKKHSNGSGGNSVECEVDWEAKFNQLNCYYSEMNNNYNDLYSTVHPQADKVKANSIQVINKNRFNRGNRRYQHRGSWNFKDNRRFQGGKLNNRNWSSWRDNR